ncbi:hypothetical protein [Vibrio alfacsensis]|uniref:hypothetical protein n=1 Tax=Vibrio alfacsensis TaxID=1074311 RepID=UPI004067F8A1
MEYLSIVIVFIGAIVAVRGDTWNERGITKWGYLTAIIAGIGFIFGIYQTYESAIDSKKKEELLESSEKNAKAAAIQINNLQLELSEYQERIDEYQDDIRNYQAKITAYQSVVGEIKEYSERQEQIVMIQAVDILPGKTWRAPNKIYSGSKIEAYFFKGHELIVRYSGRSQVLRKGTDNWAKLFVIGGSGQEFSWSIHNPTMQRFQGKIEVLSTPRSRSKDWSWLEEKLERVN